MKSLSVMSMLFKLTIHLRKFETILVKTKNEDLRDVHRAVWGKLGY